MSTSHPSGPATWVTMPLDGATTAERQEYQLKVVSGPDAGTSKKLSAEVVRVGGLKSCDLVLTDPTVSGVHFELQADEHGYRVVDLGSTNGVKIGGCLVERGFIEPGAKITIGNTVLRFKPLRSTVSVPLSPRKSFGPLVGQSLKMRELFAQLAKIATTDLTVLITGETGVGKELVAQAIVEAGSRADGPFMVFDCSTVSPNLLASELFGHERGAFTGATRTRKGLFELAHGGTLFLDEIGELSLDLQPQLLRAIERGEVRRVGGQQLMKLDVRVLAATNRDLGVEVARHAFREDLYFRLAVAQVRVPPLRERRDDIELLARLFWSQIGDVDESALAAALERWGGYGWPGNVRELRFAVERAVSFGADPPFDEAPRAPGAERVDLSIPFKQARESVLEAFEREYLQAVLDANQGNITRAAKQAGIDRMTLHKLIHRRNLETSRN